MDQQQVHVRQPQLDQAVFRGAFELPRREIALPDLGGDEHLLASDAGAAHGLADLALVVVHRRGIDVAIAEAQRLLDDALAGAPAQLPGPQSESGNARTIGLDILHGQISNPLSQISYPISAPAATG